MDTADGCSTLEIDGLGVEIIARGTGRPLLFLHPGYPGGSLDPASPLVERLSAGCRLLAPTHPGFGAAPPPRWMNTVDDLAYFYLDLLTALDLRDATLVGVSLGGWIAAAIAIKSTERLGRLVLADAVGIKIGDRETRDIADIYAVTDEHLAELVYGDPAAMKRDLSALPEADLLAIARSREATARYGWSPYLHDPKLGHRLHRIDIPTLCLWGAADGIVTPDYGRAYAAAIPGARFELIAGAGHLPHLEQPDAFVRRVHGFAGETPQP